MNYYKKDRCGKCLVCDDELYEGIYFCSYKCSSYTQKSKGDFFVDNSKIVKNSYKKLKEKIDKLDFYKKTKTRNILLQNDYYLKFRGKAKNRTMIIENPKLYKSIYENTKELNEVKYHAKSFYARIIFITKYNYNISKIKCKCGKNIKYNSEKRDFKKHCGKCYPKYPSKNYFKNKFNENWEEEQQKDSKKRKKASQGCQSLIWFKNKYGESEGIDKYRKHYQKIMGNTIKRYSEISQKLFWKIYDTLNLDINNCYFAKLNSEYRIRLTNEEMEQARQTVYFLDFLHKNKNIEFDGTYWHQNSEESDFIRDKIIEKKGYKTLRISESEYHNNKNQTLKKCVRFLNE